MTASVREDALAYARRGWHVFPVEPRGKRPACDHGKDDGTTDPVMVARMFARPAVNVGIAVEPSRLAVIDVDDDERGGGATFAALVADLGPLPPTITTDTPSGGAHYLFNAPGCDLRGKAGPGVDVIAHGYIVAAPSVHPSGRAYRWRAGCAPGEVEVADLPPKWLARLRRCVAAPALAPAPAGHDRDYTMRRAAAYLGKLPPSVSGQGGHRALWDATLALVRGFDLDADEAFALLASDFSPRCSPPWTDRELRHKITDASRAAVPAGYLLDRDLIACHRPGVVRVVRDGCRIVIAVRDNDEARAAGRAALEAIRRSGLDLACVDVADLEGADGESEARG